MITTLPRACPASRYRIAAPIPITWAGFDVIYVFQRPESMARAFAKVAAEAAPGCWLVSLEFAVPGQPPVACLQGPQRRTLWVYQPAGAAPGLLRGAQHSTTARSSR